MAGGQLKNGDVNSWVKERLDVGKIIYDSNEDSTIYCIGGGTYHKSPIVNYHGHVIHESKSCSNYLIKRGVDSKRIRREWGSYDTIANGFFAFLNFIVPLKIKDITVISSLFHIERAQVIFDYFNKLFQVNINIEYIGVENIIDEELLKIRKAREKKKADRGGALWSSGVMSSSLFLPRELMQPKRKEPNMPPTPKAMTCTEQ